MKIELHILQNFSPSNLNRDDTNSPKDCEFGGFRRARISSQSLKRAIRFNPEYKDSLASHLSVRSRQFPAQVALALRDKGVEDEISATVGEGLEGIGQLASTSASSSEPTDGEYDLNIFRTPQSVFYTPEEVRICAEAVKEELDNGSDASDILGALRSRRPRFNFPVPRSADIAMFGRMTTSQYFHDIDAACQVAHAISTNRVSMETDFYTAVDDIGIDDDTGADMMGIVGYNSSCFYRYSLIDLGQLHENIQDSDIERLALEAFIRSSIFSIPSGKQNSMAAHNPPDFILGIARSSGVPVSLSNAFISPIRPGRGESLMQASVEALDDYWGRLVGMYGTEGIAESGLCTTSDAGIPNLGDTRKQNIADLVSSLTGAGIS